MMPSVALWDYRYILCRRVLWSAQLGGHRVKIQQTCGLNPRGLWWAGPGSADVRFPATPRQVGDPTGGGVRKKGEVHRLDNLPTSSATQPHQNSLNCFTHLHGNWLPKPPWVEGPAPQIPSHLLLVILQDPSIKLTLPHTYRPRQCEIHAGQYQPSQTALRGRCYYTSTSQMRKLRLPEVTCLAKGPTALGLKPRWSGDQL